VAVTGASDAAELPELGGRLLVQPELMARTPISTAVSTVMWHGWCCRAVGTRLRRESVVNTCPPVIE
jgi:hypothetical protein